MTIEITKPEVEALIEQRLRSGAFESAEDVILHALQASEPGHLTGAALIQALQSSPYRDIDLEPQRDPMPVREAAL